MELIPLPRKITRKDGIFIITSKTAIVLDLRMDGNDLETAKLLQQEIAKITAQKIPIIKAGDEGGTQPDGCILFRCSEQRTESEAYRLTVDPAAIIITASSGRGLLYGAATLIQLCRLSRTSIGGIDIEDEPDYANRGYMLDVSRGRIPTMQNLKSQIDRLALYKINQLQLYMENGLRIEGLEEIWSQTDPFTPEEIMELDLYCFQRGIELVPCIASFGHLYDLLRSESFHRYSEMDADTGEPFTWYHRMRYHILNVSDPGSFTLITKMLDRYILLFRSRRINICCDETFDLGKGKSTPLLGQMSYGELYLSFVNRLIAYLQDKGKEVMIWADILQNHPECLGHLAPEVTCLNWYYYYDAREESVKILDENRIRQYVCPSTSGYSRLVNAYDMSFANIREMAVLGGRYGAAGFLNTEWGDTGHINMPALSIPGIIYGAAQSWNTGDTRDSGTIDGLISLLEFGDGTMQIVGLLRDLSRQDLIIFNDLTFFRDYKIYNLSYPDFGMNLYENARARIMEASAERLAAAITRCGEILQSIKQTGGVFGAAHQAEAAEFCLSARGVALMQEIVLAIKKQEYGQDVELPDTPSNLAARIECWLADYCVAWRAASRESELFRIKEFVSHICRILRRFAPESES
ncbi:MAG: beta-N-acetylhexosaminidase [Saccharofermentanales bacterium]